VSSVRSRLIAWVLLAATLSFGPGSARAAGINLSWDECGTSGSEIQTFTCDTNTGPPFALVGSFVPPAGINNFIGLSAEIRTAATTLPDWWKLGVGGCRSPSSINVSFDGGLSVCAEPWSSAPAGGLFYDLSYYGPNTARITIQAALPVDQPVALSVDEKFAFRVLISRTNTTGAGSCAGCAIPVRLTLQQIQLFQTTATGNDPVLTTPINRNIAYWQGTTGTSPDIVSFAPAGAVEGAPVTITGTGLTGTSVVRFGGIASAPSSVTNTQVVAPVPTGAHSGLIELDTPFGTAASDNAFIVAPVVTYFVPTQAPVGAAVHISGRNFTGATSVMFGTGSATFTVQSDNAIQATVPASATDGPITVTSSAGSGSLPTFRVGPADGAMNLSWDDCGGAGTNLKTFACDGNTGPGFTLVGSFTPPAGVTQFQGITSDIRIGGSSLPDWWRHGVGQCRFTNGMSVNFDFSGQTACSDPWAGTGSGLLQHSIEFYGPETARVRVTANRTSPIALAPDREYYAFKVVVARNKVTGLGMCTGCDLAVSLALQNIQLNQQGGPNPVITVPLWNTTSYWQGTPGPLPTIAGFSPPGGPAGTPVTVTGNHFTGTNSVRFGPTPATFSVVSDTEISTSAPAGFQSSPIVVNTPSGSATSVTLFYRNPDITDYIPPTAPVGTTIAIRGTGLAGTSNVRFNGTPALFTNISDVLLTAVVPVGATTGTIEVTNPGGVDVGPVFNVGPLPTGTLDLAWDDCGASGAALKTFACTADPGPAFPLVISFRPPAGAVSVTKMTARLRIEAGQLPDWWKHGAGQCRGTGDLSAVLDGTTSCPSPWATGVPVFTYEIGYYGPATARLTVEATPPGGVPIALDPGLNQTGARVLIARTMASGPGSCANCQRSVRLNLEEVQLTQSAGIPFNPVLTTAATRSTVYWQGIPGPAPQISALVPPAGGIGAPVSIRGAYFTGATSVRFNGTIATFSVVADTAISTTVPVGTRTGLVTVETPNGVVASPSPFVVAPDLQSFLPAQAPIGTVVSLIGINFTGTTQVLFNGTPATFTAVNDTLVTATVPAGATSGPITITNPGGSDVSGTPFTVGPLIAGINLSWNDCGLAGNEIQTFACNTNSGPGFFLIGSFRPPAGITQFIGFDAVVRIDAGASTLPDWWRHGASGCRGIGAISTTFNILSTTCQDLFPGNPAGTQTYDIAYYAPNTARLSLHIQFATGALNSSQEYYAFQTTIAQTKSTGASSCAGCTTPVRLELLSIQLFQNPGVGYNPILQTALHRNVAYWQGVPGPSPVVTFLEPAFGAPGETVSIHGLHLSGATAVNFQTVSGFNPSVPFTVVNDSLITTAAPLGVRTGFVTVTSPNGTAQSPQPFYVAAEIYSFAPTEGPVGRNVRIGGLNFTGASQVRFNGTPATFVISSDTLITTSVPVGATTGPIDVTTPAGTVVSQTPFTLGPGAPNGINLAWSDCGSAGVPLQTFACNVNTGGPFLLFGSFVPPDDINQFLGMSADLIVDAGAATLPDWWKFGSGQCRGATAMSTSFDFTAGPFSCLDTYYGQAAGGNLYEVGFGGPNRARLRIQAAIPVDQAQFLDSSEEYYAFRIAILKTRTTGVGSCSGCLTPVSIALQSIQLFQPAAALNDPILTTPLVSTVANWQGAPTVPSFLFAPLGGGPGTAVTLSGSGFTGTTAVEFGSYPASFTVVSNATITTSVPAGARTARIRVITPSEVFESASDFIVAPVITELSPAQAPVGSQIGIVGYNFTGSTAVRFNGVLASFSIPRDDLIIATVPASASSGPVTVTNLGGTATSPGPFTVGPLLTSEGINLSWDDCGESGVTSKTFACDVNSGPPFTLVASFRPPSGMFRYLGLSAMITIANPAGTLPEWWKHGTGFCRGSNGIQTTFDFTVNSSCLDFFAGQGVGGMYYAVGGLDGGNPSRATILVQAAVPLDLEGPLLPGLEYYGFKVNILRSSTTGSGACAGCDTPMCIELNSVQLFQPDDMNFNPIIELPADNTLVTWQGATSCGAATPVQISLVISEAHADHNLIVWELPRGDAATVYRREGEGAWQRMDRLTPDGEHRIEYIDGNVRPGMTYHYRLGFVIEGEEIFGGETALTVPAVVRTLSMARIGWSGSGIVASITLPRGGPASLEIFDLTGRRAVSKRLEGLNEGEHRVEIATRLQPGVYFAKLTQETRTVSGRFVVVQ